MNNIWKKKTHEPTYMHLNGLPLSVYPTFNSSSDCFFLYMKPDDQKKGRILPRSQAISLTTLYSMSDVNIFPEQSSRARKVVII